jgi:hypothetical protein
MAYAKLPLIIQDYGLGFQSVNQAADNEQALRDAYDAEHYVESVAFLGFGFSSVEKEFGAHDSFLIPRAVASVKTSTVTLTTGSTSTVFWFDIISPNGRVISAQATRIATGVYVLPLAFVDDQSVWVEGLPRGTGSQVRIVSTRYFAQMSSSPGPRVVVRLMERNSSSGEFEPADYDFDVALFSR